MWIEISLLLDTNDIPTLCRNVTVARGYKECPSAMRFTQSGANVCESAHLDGRPCFPLRLSDGKYAIWWPPHLTLGLVIVRAPAHGVNLDAVDDSTRSYLLPSSRTLAVVTRGEPPGVRLLAR